MKVYTASTTSELSDLVASLISGNSLEKTAVFCEDKFTLSLELAIAKKHGGTFGVNVYSFNRFMHKFLPNDKKCLSQESCSLIVKRLLLENKHRLLCFKNVYDPNLASSVYELIAQLKSAKVSVADMYRACDQSIGNLKRKLTDLTLIFDEYERFLSENSLIDGNNRLYRLPEFFDGDEQIKNTNVIIAGFPSLNKTLCEIFKSLVKNAKDVCFALVGGDNKNVYTNETFNFAMKEFAPELCSYEASSIKQALLDKLFVPGCEINEKIETEQIELFKAKNPIGEIEAVAKRIKQAVINGAKYKDFAVTCESVDDYELIVKTVFDDYEIPFFIDKKNNLGKHPLTRLICSYIDVVRTNFDTEKVLELVKNPLFCPDKELADEFEDYYISYAINRKTVKEPFVYGHKFLLEFECLRIKLCKICTFLKREQTVRESFNAINEVLNELNAFELTENLSENLEKLNFKELASYNRQGIDLFKSVCEEIVALLYDRVLPLTDVKNVILSGMTSCEVFLIPEYNDCVFVGDFRSVKYSAYNTVFAVGLTSAVPSSKLDTALLCDRDIDKMMSSNVLVEPKIKEVNRRSREIACMALASFSKKLVLSYPASSSDGKQTLPSEMFLTAENLFKNTALNERENECFADDYITRRRALLEFVKQVNSYKEGKDGSIKTFDGATAYYSAVQDDETLAFKKNTLDRFLNSANTEIGYYSAGVNYAENGLSATSLEGYFACPYKNFIQRGLKIAERKKSRIMANDLGTMVHSIAEEFVKKVNFNGELESALKLADEIFDSVIKKPEYSRYLKSVEGEKSFALIKNECQKLCGDLFMGVKNSSFKPAKTEIAFGFKGGTKMTVDTKFGVKNVTGMIDRIDLFNDNMRIVDYKTGYIEESKIEENLYSGKKLQLFLYTKAFDKKYYPTGVYYFPIENGFVAPDESAVMSLTGRTLADISLIRELDYTITDENSKGTYVNADIKVNKQGELASKKLLTQEEFAAFSDYAKAVAGTALEEIAEGVITAAPAEGACTYCKYHGICGYDDTENRMRKVKGITKESIVRAMSDERNLHEENDDE